MFNYIKYFNKVFDGFPPDKIIKAIKAYILPIVTYIIKA